MSFDEETLEHEGADCRECPAYEFCEMGTEQNSDACHEMLNQPTPREADHDPR